MWGGHGGGHGGGRGGGHGGGHGGGGAAASGGYLGGQPVPITEQVLMMDPAKYILGAQFPEAVWRPDLYALLAIPEFEATDWRNKLSVTDPKDFTADSVKKDVFDLTAHTGARNQRADEILDQDGRLHIYFAQALMLTPSAHPHSLRVLEIAFQIGGMIAVYFKKKYNRARPQQLCPALMPLIPGPMHPAYPSGHSLQSYLIASALGEVAPHAKDLLEALALRIAKNREIAGVHFTSDSEAGKTLAHQAILLLMDEQKCPTFAEELKAAKKEHPIKV